MCQAIKPSFDALIREKRLDAIFEKKTSGFLFFRYTVHQSKIRYNLVRQAGMQDVSFLDHNAKD